MFPLLFLYYDTKCYGPNWLVRGLLSPIVSLSVPSVALQARGRQPGRLLLDQLSPLLLLAFVCCLERRICRAFVVASVPPEQLSASEAGISLPSRRCCRSLCFSPSLHPPHLILAGCVVWLHSWVGVIQLSKNKATLPLPHPYPNSFSLSFSGFVNLQKIKINNKNNRKKKNKNEKIPPVSNISCRSETGAGHSEGVINVPPFPGCHILARHAASSSGRCCQLLPPPTTPTSCREKEAPLSAVMPANYTPSTKWSMLLPATRPP